MGVNGINQSVLTFAQFLDLIFNPVPTLANYIIIGSVPRTIPSVYKYLDSTTFWMFSYELFYIVSLSDLFISVIGTRYPFRVGSE